MLAHLTNTTTFTSVWYTIGKSSRCSRNKNREKTRVRSNSIWNSNWSCLIWRTGGFIKLIDPSDEGRLFYRRFETGAHTRNPVGCHGSLRRWLWLILGLPTCEAVEMETENFLATNLELGWTKYARSARMTCGFTSGGTLGRDTGAFRITKCTLI